MIRQITAIEPRIPPNEAALCLLGQYAAYGGERSFLRFYEDETGSLLSIMEGAATLSAVGDTAEMRLFLSMDSEVRCVRTDAQTACRLAEDWGTVAVTGEVMQLHQPVSVENPAEALAAREAYPVLRTAFGEALPPFEAWYADVSHRLRHDSGRLVGIIENGRAIATAMLTARTECAGLIGAVATLPEARGRGCAHRCVMTLAASLQAEGRQVWLSPKNDYAAALYARWGFETSGRWGRVHK